MYRAEQRPPGRALSDSGKRIHAAGRFGVAPEGVELLTPAHGAQIRRVDSLWRYAGFFELPPIGGWQIDVPSSLPSEMCRHLRAHLVAALADTRTDCGMQVRGARPEAPAHGGDSIRHDARRRAAPAGVHRCHRPPPLIHQQNGNAIRRLDGHHAAWLVLDQRVAFAEEPGAPLGGYAPTGVNLFQRGELREAGGNIGQARAEAMHQPWKSVELGDAVDAFGVPVEHDLYGVLGLRDADLRLELGQHGFIQPDFGGPLHQRGHLVDLVLQLHQRVKQILRPRRAAGEVDIDRDNPIHALQHGVGIERSAHAGAGAHGDAPLRVRHLVPDAFQHRGHLEGDGARDDHQIALPRAGDGGSDFLQPALRNFIYWFDTTLPKIPVTYAQPAAHSIN